MMPVYMADYSIGVDLGGTNLRAAAIDRGGAMLEGISGVTNFSAGRDAVLGDIVQAIEALRERHGKQGLAGIGEGALGGQEQQGVGGDAEGGGGFHRRGAADLGLADAQQSFLFAKVDLNTPAMQIGFDEKLGVEVGVGAEQEGGLAIEEFAPGGQAVPQRGDHHEQ